MVTSFSRTIAGEALARVSWTRWWWRCAMLEFAGSASGGRRSSSDRPPDQGPQADQGKARGRDPAAGTPAQNGLTRTRLHLAASSLDWRCYNITFHARKPLLFGATSMVCLQAGPWPATGLPPR